MRSGKYYQAIKHNGQKRDLHRVIAEQKLGRPLGTDEVVHHIDGNKQNNHPDNIEVMSLSEHSRLHQLGRHMKPDTRKKLSMAFKGKPNYPRRKLTDKQALSVFDLRNKGLTFRQIGKQLGISHDCVMDIYYGKHYQNITEQYRKTEKGA
jgi:DNA-binding NarL/FixJ family response regulator